MKNNFEKYKNAVEYLESIVNLDQPDYMSLKRGRSLFLRRFEYFLKNLGNPQNSLKFIHVGGTSGKGSVATMIQTILTEAKIKTGLYLSPHPTTTIERIKVNNLFIAPDEFADLVEKIKPMIDKTYLNSPYGRPSYFEILTALAFLYFKKQKCEYAVLEVGLGGKYDATNIIKKAEATVINKIGYDHEHILGNSLEEIAKEKAGIIKPKTDFFTTEQNNKNVINIFEKICRKNKIKCNIVTKPEEKYKLKLLGKHQQQNAALALAVTKKIGIKETKIKTGLNRVKMSCRTEIIQKNPLVILDGAHNKSKMDSTVRIIKNLTYKKLYLIIALTNTRNPVEIFKKIKPSADYFFVTRYQSTERKCYSPKELAKKLKLKKTVEIYLDSQMALEKALKLANKDDLILVTGSFFLAGELRKNWRSEEDILKERII